MSAEQDRPVANGQSAIYPSLAGKRVFLTGGGGGIGASMTRAFSQQGARVAFVDVAEEPSVALVRELEGGPGAPSFRRCDLTDVDDLEAAIADAADAMGGIDILINNAANDDRHTLDDVMAREAERLLEETNWLPEPLRTPDEEGTAPLPAANDGGEDALPPGLAADADNRVDEEGGADAIAAE